MGLRQPTNHVQLLAEALLRNDSVAFLFQLRGVVKILGWPFRWQHVPPPLGELVDELVLAGRLRSNCLRFGGRFVILFLDFVIDLFCLWFPLFLRLLLDRLLLPVVLLCWVSFLDVLTDSGVTYL